MFARAVSKFIMPSRPVKSGFVCSSLNLRGTGFQGFLTGCGKNSGNRSLPRNGEGVTDGTKTRDVVLLQPEELGGEYHVNRR
jgi:hypothetical protein